MANIGTTTAFYKVETSLTRANQEVSKSMERLATGRQNANAGDRSSYVAMADTFRLDFVSTKAGIKGASVVMGYLETGMRVLDAASALLSRLQELAVLGANNTNTVADMEAINLEAEAIADRVGVINQGEIIIVEEKSELLKKMGHKTLTVELQQEIKEVPTSLKKYNLGIGNNRMSLDYTYNLTEKQTGITNLLQDIKDSGLKLKDLKTEQSNLEKIFVTLVRENNEN